MVDLDDTSRCPLDRRCATCSAENDLAIGTAISQLGVHCITLCGTCAERGRLPGMAALTAAAAVAEHCGHLGIDLDTAAAIFETERQAVRS